MPSTTGALYGRQCKLTVLIPTTATDDYGDTIATQLEINGEDTPDQPGQRIQAKISRDLHGEPNTSEIIITNLAESTRQSLQTKGVKVRLEAGYVGTGVATLFYGDVRIIDHVRQVADWNSILHLGDGERSWRYARVHRSFPGGTTAAQVLAEIASASGLALGNSSQAQQVLQKKVFQQRYVLSGRAGHALDQLMKKLPYTGSRPWSASVQDGALQLLAPGQVLQASVPLLTPSTGLLDSPQMGTPEKSGQPALLKFRSLLTPSTLGGTVQIQSERYPNATLQVRKLEYLLDTHGGDWFSDFHAVVLRSTGTSS